LYDLNERKERRKGGKNGGKKGEYFTVYCHDNQLRGKRERERKAG
jgi:hypothetical protein